MKKNIIFSVICALAAFLCVFALASPPRYAYSYDIDAEGINVVQKLTTEDIVTLNNCSLSGNRVTVSGDDAYIIFKSAAPVKGEMFILRHSDPAYSSARVQVYYADESEAFSEAQTGVSYFFKNDPVVIDIPESEITFFRLDIDTDYTFESLEFLDADLPTKALYHHTSVSGWLISVGVALIVCGIVFFISSKFGTAERAAEYIKQHYVRGLIFAGLTVLAVLAAVLIELLLILLLEKDFNKSRLAIFFSVAESVVIFAFFFKDTYKNLPAMTAAIILALGTTFIFASPMAHISWDTESHYEWAINTSYIGDVYLTQADMDIEKNSADFLYLTPETYTDDNIRVYNEKGSEYINVIQTNDRMISSLPSGIFLALGRLMNLPFYVRFCLGKLANLICYALLALLTVKKVQSGRVIAAIILLFPTNVFLAANYAYDWWVTGFIMLGMACFVNECQHQDKQITVTDTIIMCGAFALGCIPKLLYAPLLFIPFFMHKKDFKNKKTYYALCTAVIVVLIASLLVRGSASVASGGDTRGGAVSIKGQAKYILANPLGYARLLFDFLCNYLSVSWAESYINFFAYMGHTRFAGAVVALMITAAITDKSEIDRYASNWLIRTGEVFMFIAMAAIIATALYLDFTPVGTDEILGCQSRYLTPLIYPFIALLGYGKSPNTMNKSVYAKMMLAPMTVIMLYDFATVLI